MILELFNAFMEAWRRACGGYLKNLNYSHIIGKSNIFITIQEPRKKKKNNRVVLLKKKTAIYES